MLVHFGEARVHKDKEVGELPYIPCSIWRSTVLYLYVVWFMRGFKNNFIKHSICVFPTGGITSPGWYRIRAGQGGGSMVWSPGRVWPPAHSQHETVSQSGHLTLHGHSRHITLNYSGREWGLYEMSCIFQTTNTLLETKLLDIIFIISVGVTHRRA